MSQHQTLIGSGGDMTRRFGALYQSFDFPYDVADLGLLEHDKNVDSEAK